MLSYNELIRHFILTETQYKDDLELLIKLFRNPIRPFFADQPAVRLVDSRTQGGLTVLV